MSDALTRILLQRERLVHRVARQRESVVVAFAGLSGPIAIVDRIAAAARFLRAHPPLAFALGAAVVVLRARTVIGMLGRGISLWRLVRSVRTLVERLNP